QPETSNGAASVVSKLEALAKQHNERFKQEQEMRKLRDEEERRMRMGVKPEDDLFGDDELEYNASYAGSKRNISHVDSPEEGARPAPSFVVLPSQIVQEVSYSGWLVIIKYSSSGSRFRYRCSTRSRLSAPIP